MSDEKKPKTFAEEIEEAVGDEPIQATIIGRYPDDEECPKDRVVRPELRGKLLAWNIARRALNYSRQREETDCHAVFVYTPKHIYFLASYDGQDSIEWLPRNPTPKEPWFVGR